MNHSSRRRRAAAVATFTTLVAPALLAAGPAGPAAATPAAAAPADTDARPATIGAAWLAGQLEAGLMYNPTFGGFDDYGLSIDAAFALAAVGGQEAAVEAVTDAIATNVNSYTTNADYGGPDDVNAGPSAKALSLATEQGRDVRDFGGVDLLARVESTVLTDPATSGRIKDISAWGDYANVIGQGFAARSLHAAGSGLADEVTGFLLDQQCAAGFFRLGFSPEGAADQTCDGDPDATPDPDATALSVLALLDQRGTPEVGDAIGAATDWLLDRQRRSGALGGGTATEAANTNSTGLAGWVFGEVGADEAATRAAAWVRSHQADDARGCPTALRRHTGAVGYDRTGLAGGRSEGITDDSSDQWRRATSQALPALAWAPAATGARLTGPDGYLRGGSSPRLLVTGAAPGSSLCVGRGEQARALHANRNGNAAVRVPMPRWTRTAAVPARTGAGTLDVVQLDVLGPLTIEPRTARARVARGGTQTVRVAGLAPGEQVTVRYRGEVVRRRTADADGVARAGFRVGRVPGKAGVTVLGEFPRTRRGTAEFRVRR